MSDSVFDPPERFAMPEIEEIIAVRSGGQSEFVEVEVPAHFAGSKMSSTLVLRFSWAAVQTLAPALWRMLENRGLDPTEEAATPPTRQ